MTLLSEASFLVTPNGYKASKLYAAIPTNGNGDMTVTRATTATRVDENDLVSSVASNVPRIDYTGGGCPSILLEPQRTNLITYSEDFTQYTNSNTTDTANTVTSPDGTVNGTTLTASGSGSFNHIITSPAYTIASGEITSSIFAKKGTVNYIRLRLNGTTSGERAWYNLNNGTIDGEDVSGSAKIEDYGNGWYRCSLTSSSNIASGSGKSLQIFIQDSGGSQTAWTANGTENIYIWGTQTEQGAYPTSYIPTEGSTVTRNADVLSRDNIYTNNLIVGGGGTWFVHLINNTAFTSDANGNLFLDTASGGITNGINIRSIGTVARLYINFYTSGVNTFQYLTTTDTVKLAIKWNGATADVFENGAKVVSATIFATTAMEHLGGNGSDQPKYIKQMALFAKPLTDAQCIALTTL